LFYHYPREELIADGKVPWRDFIWQYNQPNGEMDDKEFNPIAKNCGPDLGDRTVPHDDDEDDRLHKRQRAPGILRRVSQWMDSHGRSRGRSLDWDHGSGWCKGESSRGKSRARQELSSPPSHVNNPKYEKRALRSLWQTKGSLDSEVLHVD
jgi:hypothetical protein